ncbi:unnamed protein product [Trichogramma brassicae]|uniref:Homeobox protein cut-like n=1 Tax=Trichogramma brassicae TaxID=86971 RepID=A0A6H5HY70_9HYME|nr:unnamed protein product [Trichogramma brassicae]
MKREQSIERELWQAINANLFDKSRERSNICIPQFICIFAGIRRQISQLRDELGRLQVSLQRIQETTSQATSRLEEELEARRQHIALLEAKLERQKDYEELKREIQVLRSVDLAQIAESGKNLEQFLIERNKALQQQAADALKPPSTPDALGGLSSPLQRTASASPHGSAAAQAAAPASLVSSQAPPSQPPPPPSQVPPPHSRSTPTPSCSSSVTSTTSSSILFPPPLQNVETFGSFLGEEIVANWRRTLERSIINQQQQQQQQQSTAQAQPSLNHQLASPTDCNVVKSSTPQEAEKAPTPLSGHETPTLTSPSVQQQQQQQTPSSVSDLVNGPIGATLPTKSPAQATDSECHSINNNSHHLANNNNVIGVGSGGATSGSLNMLESLKSPFRFDERTHPFRFGDEYGVAGMAGRLGESLIPKGDPMEARLQEMLRYNMDKYASQNLDTLHIARRVRELLSIHNIGQRLFAKYVLGLSQGTVSELLSKPKPWDKLTEKGRDSYRKMHSWACDDNAVMLLKSLIPKKVSSSCGNENRALVAQIISGQRKGEAFAARSQACTHIGTQLKNAPQVVPSRVEYVSGKEQSSAGGMPGFPRPSQDSQSSMPGVGNSASDNGTSGGAPGSVSAQEMSQEQQRIAHMLSESGHMLRAQQSEHEASNDADSKSPSRLNCPSPFGSKDSQNRRLKKYENDDIPQEKVARIYQEELAKLMVRRNEEMRGAIPSRHGPHSRRNQNGSGSLSARAAQVQHRSKFAVPATNIQPIGAPAARDSATPLGDKRRRIEFGRSRRAAAAAAAAAAAQDLSLGNILRNKMINGVSEEEKEKMEEAMRHAGSAFSLVKPKQEPASSAAAAVGSQSTPGGSSASSPLGNSILPPAMTPSEEFTGAAAASPLQRMASITNSLISQPSTPTHHSGNQRPLKAVLPPITQQQFDIYNNLNTEDIVKRVKEQLSQYSISQRLFGESVLGLSQGSVSDLLARPKPWHMLTQKGREPFIRMKMFLEDDNAVHKLVASQYKIAPEKLMRTGGYGGLPPNATHETRPRAITKCSESPSRGTSGRGRSTSARESDATRSTTAKSQLSQQSPMMLTPPGSVHAQLSIQELQKKQQQQQQQQHQSGQMNLHSPHHQMAQSPLRALHPHISPSVYEMAALTQDLDTQTITTKIKEALLANNIGQKIFGEAVLGLSQGSVSELLSKPKPWHMLSIKGREPFIRMQLWLADPSNIERLQALKNERREANKKRRSSGPGHDNSSDTSSNDTAEFYHAASPGPGPGPTSAKKQRVLFSEEQKEALRLAFTLDAYPNVQTIEFLAGELGLSSRTITNWFHNHRMRLKQQTPHGPPEPPSPSREPGQPFDAVQFRVLLNQRLLDLQKERLGLGNVTLNYPPYFNPNLAALVGNALKEQCAGLDLSMGSLKREFDDDDGDDAMSNLGSEDSDGSSGSVKGRESADIPAPANSAPSGGVGSGASAGRSNRRKPAAPQWVNPEWQEPSAARAAAATAAAAADEVIINGVCVMQTDDYSVKREPTEETVRVDPTPVLDRYEDEAQSDDASSSVSAHNAQADRGSLSPSPKSTVNSPAASPRPPSASQSQTAENSPKEPRDHKYLAYDYRRKSNSSGAK